MNLLFVSNLFPSEDEPFRGLDNATLLPHLRGHGIESIRALGLRPTLNPKHWGERSDITPRDCDIPFAPRYVGVPYIPKIGSRINHRLLKKAVSRALDRIHRESPIDAVLVSWLYPDGCGVGKWCAEHQIPYVMICQGSDAHVYLDKPERRQYILTAAASRGVITRSRDLARRLQESGAAPEKLHPIYNGIDHQVFFPGDQKQARTELGISQEGSIALFVGNFLPVKNPLLLVEAWKNLPSSQNCRLVMIGSGPMEQAIRNAAGDTPSLVLPGRLGAEEIGRYMRAADVLCLSSHGEGVPNVILEAFGCGLPVISTDVGGIAEVVDSDELGCLVPPGDRAGYTTALANLLDSTPDREGISTHGREFTWDAAAKSYAKILAGGSR